MSTLKPDRLYNPADIVTHYSMYETGTRGGIVCQATGFYPVGAGTDSSEQRCYYVNGNPSGFKPVGLLINDVVNKDLTQTHINYHKDEVQIGEKVVVAKKGEFVTNRIGPGQASGVALTLPARAYVGPSGYLYTAAGYATSGWTEVGRFTTYVNTEGFARFEANIQ